MPATPQADLSRVEAHVTGAEPPDNAPREVSQPLAPGAGGIRIGVNPRTGESYAREEWHLMSPAERARHNERELAPLVATGPKQSAAQPSHGVPAAHGPTQGGIAEAVDAVAEGKLDPFYANLRQQPASRGHMDTELPALPAAPTQPQPAAPARAGRITRAQRVTRPPVDELPALPALPALPQEAVVAVPATVAAPSASRVTHADLPGDSAGVPAPDAPAAEAPATAAIALPALPAAQPVQYVGDTSTPVAPAAPVDLTIYPAGSDTEDPTRGQPRLPVRPGKEITGGFADQVALQYFALDGYELGRLVQDMLQSVHDRISNDLRFNEAITYPRVGVRVWVEVAGFADDQGFTVDKVVPDAVPYAGQAARDPSVTQTPLELAREVADEIVFVLVAEKRETDAHGEPLDPPDKIRQELGLPRPRKQIVRGPGNSSQMVDKLT